MKIPFSRLYPQAAAALVVTNLIFMTMACKPGSSSSSPRNLTETQLAEQVPLHVGKDHPAVAQKAKSLSDLMQARRPVEAFDQALQLMSERELSEEEREWVLQSFTSVMTSLQKEADKGNKQAKAALEDYRATK